MRFEGADEGPTTTVKRALAANLALSNSSQTDVWAPTPRQSPLSRSSKESLRQPSESCHGNPVVGTAIVVVTVMVVKSNRIL
ncbi:uncharacterized protein PHALS_13794 [Plasmopara halstedii]|uniref:Uncharacterized protein n=1 Tax=Plasmopara halstedii TaxID=4781 RepID=A0A0N7L689_PLAHL|nr:uncharacterized protein PHALS_13794 [Plasmopara halstedii]CEG43603.1 hypothetical protein PHALS_13794 [Plasmopara halstedii]|eukprot:XP_024579972.1 hypothetical protein PHALS_13794 [Plasmopara halstedii]